MRRCNYHEEIEVYGATDRVRIEAGKDGSHGRGGLPEDAVSEATFYNLKKKYDGLGTAELRRLRQLGEENLQLKPVVADLTLNKQMLQGGLRKCVKAKQTKQLVRWLLDSYRISESPACSVVAISRKVFRYIDRPRDDRASRKRMRDNADTRVRYGFWRIQTVLRREGWRVNHKRAYGSYREEWLNLRRKRPRRRKAAAHRMERPTLTGPHMLEHGLRGGPSYLTAAVSGS